MQMETQYTREARIEQREWRGGSCVSDRVLGVEEGKSERAFTLASSCPGCAGTSGSRGRPRHASPSVRLSEPGTSSPGTVPGSDMLLNPPRLKRVGRGKRLIRMNWS
jgi:hypothetical protein